LATSTKLRVLGDPPHECFQCPTPVKAVAQAPKSLNIWLCAKHLKRWVDQDRSTAGWEYWQLKNEVESSPLSGM